MAHVRKTTTIPGVVEAIVDGVAPDGRPLVTSGEEEPPVPATPLWLPTPIDWAACRGVRVLIGFINGDPHSPVIVGLLEAPPVTPQPQILALTGGQEVVLQCGKARIELRADGTVAVLGERILSRAKGVNRIKGGAVQIN
jgi:hypothetical protein